MSEKKMKPLMRIVSLVTDKVMLGKDPSKPYIGLEHIPSSGSSLIGIGSAVDSISTNNVFRAGDTLFGKLRPRLLKSMRANFDGYCSTDILVLRSNEPADEVFVSFVLRSEPVFAEAIRTEEGTKMPRCSWQSLRNLKVFWPGPTARAYIEEVLSTVDKAIEQTEAQIAKYEQIKAGLIHDLFTRGVTPDGNLRPPRAEAPKLYKKSPLGWIPKVWDCVVTESRVKVIDAQPDHRTPPEVPEGYPYVGIGDISLAGEVLFNEARRVSPAAFQKQLASFEIDPGAFIFGKIGTLGSPTRIPHERFFALSANIVLLSTKVREVADFVFWVYNSHLIARQVLDATNTTSQPALGIQKIRKFLLPWSSCEKERATIASRLEAIHRAVQSLETEKQKGLLLKRGLMQDLLTGRVRVKVGESARR